MKIGFFTIAILNICLIWALCYTYPSFSEFFVANTFFFCLIFLGVLCMFRCIYLKLDSNLYVGSVLLFVGCVGVVQNSGFIDISFYTSLYVFSFCFASLMVFVFFRQNIHLKLFAIVFTLVLILFMYERNLFGLEIFTALIFMYLLFLFAMINYVWSKNQRRT